MFTGMEYTKYNMENSRYLVNRALKTFLFMTGAKPGQQDKVRFLRLCDFEITLFF